MDRWDVTLVFSKCRIDCSTERAVVAQRDEFMEELRGLFWKARRNDWGHWREWSSGQMFLRKACGVVVYRGVRIVILMKWGENMYGVQRIRLAPCGTCAASSRLYVYSSDFWAPGQITSGSFCFPGSPKPNMCSFALQYLFPGSSMPVDSTLPAENRYCRRSSCWWLSNTHNLRYTRLPRVCSHSKLLVAVWYDFVFEYWATLRKLEFSELRPIHDNSDGEGRTTFYCI